MFQQLVSLTAMVEPYHPNHHAFWDDDHISQQMLSAHLNGESDGASRTYAFMDRSVEWLTTVAPVQEYPRLLDLGCGPGLYAQRFARKGYAVTGVDISRCSLRYAREQAEAEGVPIGYHLCDYCQLDLQEQFDLITLIYCDYGVLNPAQRHAVLCRAWAHLRPGGRMVLDVFAAAHESRFQPYQTWQCCPDGGFWSEEPHLVLEEGRLYANHVIGQQILVITPNEIKPYYLWNTCYTPDSLAKEAEAAGFQVAGVFGDVAGMLYHKDSDTLTMILEKAA